MFHFARITDSTIDGEGIALVIYFMGCSKNCKGCHNPELQQQTDTNPGMDTQKILGYLREMEGFYDSVVFSGGDPLEQPNALYHLASKIKIKKILYTGKLFENINPKILKVIDVVIDGPYDETKKTGGFPASSNQRIFYKDMDSDGNWINVNR